MLSPRPRRPLGAPRPLCWAHAEFFMLGRSCQSERFRHADRQNPTQLNFLQGDENVHFIGGFVSSCGWWLRHRPGSEDVTGAVTWVSVQSTLVFWFNKNCASRGPWGRRHRGARGPARSRARPGERRSVHKSAKMASRSCFGSFVYTVATREGRAQGRGNAGVYTDWRKWPLGAVLGHLCTLLRLARVMRESVGTQECTQIGGNGLSGLFWGIRVHYCDSRGSRASGAAARLASLPKQQPT